MGGHNAFKLNSPTYVDSNSEVNMPKVFYIENITKRISQIHHHVLQNSRFKLNSIESNEILNRFENPHQKFY